MERGVEFIDEELFYTTEELFYSSTRRRTWRGERAGPGAAPSARRSGACPCPARSAGKVRRRRTKQILCVVCESCVICHRNCVKNVM